ncbi:MAG: aldehyde dehydrogenase [Phycisphaeraceae bacterium]|nr:aldehyde dehydrogenase [Phycisphaeraceae bacterium]
MDQQTLIANVVQEVLKQLGPGKAVVTAQPARDGGNSRGSGFAGRPGIHGDVNAAVESATRAQHQLATAGIGIRDQICKLLKKMALDRAQEWGQFEFDETRIGRLDHKVAKLELLTNVPGVEFLTTRAHSGDKGIGLDEAAPWGVIGAITPVTHSIPTLTANAINMIAAGNSLVVNPHPGGAKSASMAAAAYNEAIASRFRIDPLINVIDPPTLRTAEEIFQHPGIPLLVVTGGPAVARAAMKQSKRAIVAGPGNPPVVVDETADLDNAARSIIAGGSFDNNLLCIGEKEVFVVASVFDKMMAAMRRAGAVELNGSQIDKLTAAAIKWEKDHHAVNKEYIGKDCSVLARAAGLELNKPCDLLFGETDETNPFVPEEQMMPFVPFVRVRDFEQGLELSIKHEHGFGHTAIIHSNNLANITRMGRVMNTTLFAVNGPCTACLGVGGEGYASYSIATPTGEGVTNPLTFTRFRRMSVSGALRIV